MTRQKTDTLASDRIARVLDKLVSAAAGILAVLLIGFSGYVLYDTTYVQNQAFLSTADLEQYKPVQQQGTVYTPSTLAEENADYRAWLTMDDTPIDYPVMQGSDDLYYAAHDMLKSSSLSGAIYLAAGNTPDFSDSYNIVYGHHMKNGAMFGSLTSYVRDDGTLDTAYYNAHRTGTLIVGNVQYDLRVFAVASTDAYEMALYTPGNYAEEALGFLRNPSGLTTTLIFDDDALSAVDKTDSPKHVLMLSTCAAATNARLVVFALMGVHDSSADVPEVPSEPTNPRDTPAPAQADSSVKGLPGWLNPTLAKDANAWALVNLLSLLLTLYLTVPVAHLRDKFARVKLVRQLVCTRSIQPADATVSRQKPDAQRFSRRVRAGVLTEAMLAAAALVVFILTEDLTAPMTLVDAWTPVMLVLQLAGWIVDVRLLRYREKNA